MLAAILAFLSQSWVGQLVSTLLDWWNKKQAAQNDANSAEQAAETAHQNDGAQSVADHDSIDQQNASLDAQEKKLDQPKAP